jgi:hypothetical protein
LVIIGKKAETTFNVPDDLPDHSGEPAAQTPSAPTQTETTAAVAKVETPVVSTPVITPAPTPKVEEQPKPAIAPIVAVATPPPVAPTTAVVTEAPKPVQPAAPPTATISESNAAPVAKSVPPKPVEAASTVPQKELFSATNIAIVSVAFTLLVCGFLFLTARNARRAARSSLITRSLDRERK